MEAEEIAYQDVKLEKDPQKKKSEWRERESGRGSQRGREEREFASVWDKDSDSSRLWKDVKNFYWKAKPKFKKGKTHFYNSFSLGQIFQKNMKPLKTSRSKD